MIPLKILNPPIFDFSFLFLLSNWRFQLLKRPILSFKYDKGKQVIVFLILINIFLIMKEEVSAENISSWTGKELLAVKEELMKVPQEERPSYLSTVY